ncbi:hypothetical protein J7J90_03250 [Candidatus Micrarchaeota archaeon]|nr:hypothetical protein [Candidatus Micrarchaeota archaeon]
MRNVILLTLAFTLAFGLMFMSGCTIPGIGPGPGTPGANSTNLSGSGAGNFVLFTDPRDNSSAVIISRLSELTGANIQTRCVDFSKVLYNKSSDAETICKQQNPTYDQDVAMLQDNIKNKKGSFLYYILNSNYLPVQMSANPAITAGNMCDYSGCTKPDVEPVNATVYIVNDDDKSALNFFDSLKQYYGLTFDYQYVTLDDDTKKELERYGVEHAPVFVLDKTKLDKDNKIAVDLVFPQLINPQIAPQIGWSIKDMDNEYVGEPILLSDADHYLGKVIEAQGILYVKTSGDEKYFDGLENIGIKLDYTTKTYNSTTDNISADYLPYLEITNISSDDKQEMISKLNSTRYYTVNENDDAFSVELKSPDLKNYIGDGYNNVTLDIYIMSHCPFGLQMQKAVIPVAELFENVSSVSINNKFVQYTMHGPQETSDNLDEYCINKNYPDKFWDYLECFVEAGKADDCMDKMEIDKTVISQCANETTDTYGIQGTSFPIYADENDEYGVRGSPTSVLNGKKVQMPRNAEEIKEIICARLKDKPPECDTDLSSYGNAAPSFGPVASGSSSSGSTATCG